MLEDLDNLTCIDCGAMIAIKDAATDRTFALTPEVVLCNACAVRRGGVYDDVDDNLQYLENSPLTAASCRS